MSGDMEATRESMKAEASPALVPTRFHRALVHVVDEAVDAADAADLGHWLHEHRWELQLAQSPGVMRWQLNHLDARAENHAATIRKAVLDSLDAASEACAVPPFDVLHIETHATLYHHGGQFDWHDDIEDYEGEIVPTRRLSFCCYFHSPQQMFSGGELEFMDGTTVAPKHRSIALFHPVQQHRVRAVECYSAEALHGRWAVTGWVHGEPPEGWLERLPRLRGRPKSG